MTTNNSLPSINIVSINPLTIINETPKKTTKTYKQSFFTTFCEKSQQIKKTTRTGNMENDEKYLIIGNLTDYKNNFVLFGRR